MSWVAETRESTSSWSNGSRNISGDDYFLLIDDTYFLLIDDTNKLIIQEGAGQWTNETKN